MNGSISMGAGPWGAMDRRAFLRCMGLGAAAGLLSCQAGTGRLRADRPWNFIIVLVDDLGWIDLGCMGSRYYETPNIDGLASQGMRFTNAYAACAVCSPTRASVMTGRYPTRTGITNWIWARFQGGHLPEPGEEWPEYTDIGDGKGQKLLCPRNPFWMELEEITIAEALKEAGYISGHIGKWHLGMDDWYPEKQGFDFNAGGCDFGHPPSYFDPFYNKNQGFIPTLKPRQEGEYLTDRESGEAVRFIQANRGRPFFLHLAHYAVHTPLQGKGALVEKYQAKEKTLQNNATYAAMVQSVDESMGRVLKTLDELKIADRTVVIFTSDNGGLMRATNNAPLRAGKGYPYEGGIRVPSIIRWPGVTRAGAVSDVPITSVDYFPTLLAAAGIPLPAGRPIDGKDLKPILDGRGSLDRDALYWHFPHYRGSGENLIEPYSIIRAGDWKLIKRYEGKPFELFNLADDLGETQDLAEKEPETVKALNARLEAWLGETGGKVPIANPAVGEK